MEPEQLRQLKAILCSLVISSNKTMTIKSLNIDYRQCEGRNIPYDEMGFESLHAFLLSIPDTVKIYGSGEESVVKHVPNEKTLHIERLVSHQKKAPNGSGSIWKSSGVNEMRFHKSETPAQVRPSYNVKYDSQKALQYKRDCRSSNHKSRNFIKRQKENIGNRREKVIYSKKQMVSGSNALERCENSSNKNTSQNSNSYTKQPQNSEIFKMQQLSDNLPNVEQTTDNNDEGVPDWTLNYAVFLTCFPEGACKPGDTIPPYTFPDDLIVDNVLPIFISEVHNPQTFWFHIHNRYSELDNIMLKLEDVYAIVGKRGYSIPTTSITTGLICAAPFLGKWYRGEIVSPPNDGKAKVHFVDYGTVSEVNELDIKYLLKIYASIPRQAVRGVLSHIRPRESYWTVEATHCFLDIVMDKMLYSKVCDVDKKNMVVHMLIHDPSSKDTMQINKTLAKTGFAVIELEWKKFQKEVLQREKSYGNYPTHEILEQGLYPSLEELMNFREKGIDYEKNTLHHSPRLNDEDILINVFRNLPYSLLPTNPFRLDILLSLID